MDSMRWKYIVLHSLAHLLIASAVCYFFSLPPLQCLLVFFVSVIIDIDHLPLVVKYGVLGYLRLRSEEEFGKPRRYALHNVYVIQISIILSVILGFLGQMFVSIVLMSAVAHLAWDLFEDAKILKMKIDHWL